MIKNIWAYLDELKTYLENKTSLPIFAWKPMWDRDWKYIFFTLVNNIPQISWDRRGTERKEALFDFFFVGGGKGIADVELYEEVDTFSNAVLTDCMQNIDLWNITIHSITEWVQSGILRDVKDNPYIVGQYSISYTYRY